MYIVRWKQMDGGGGWLPVDQVESIGGEKLKNQADVSPVITTYV